MALFAIAAALTAAQAVVGIKAGKKARKRNRVQEQITRIQNERAKRQFLQQFRIARADVLAAGLASGAALGSSGIQGIRSSLAAQGRVTLAETNRLIGLGGESTRLTREQLRLQGVSSILGAGSSIALIQAQR
jgi:hypothetical protein